MDMPKPEDIFARTIAVIGREAFACLQASRVIVFGMGGVGAACAEALARSGVGTLALVDHDRVSPSNLNRQLIALHSTLGELKTEACKRRLLDINPGMQVLDHSLFYGEDTKEDLSLTDYDAAADCVDTLSAKLLIAREARQAGTYLVSCMGAGNRLDPGRLRFADIHQTHTDPLARRMRKACKEQGIRNLRVLFSDETPRPVVTDSDNGRHAPGSMAFVPPVAGMMMAGELVRHLIQGAALPPIPG